MAKEKFVTGIDIGASKIRCLIGERGPQGVFNILACGVTKHNCLKKGAVVNLKGLSDAISKAIYKAEEESEQKIHLAFINVSDPNAEGIPSHSEVIISDRDSEITHYDTERVINNARSINIPYEREIFHTVHHGYIVDGEKGIVDPAGMFGFKLEADLYLITVKAALVENLKKAVRQTGIGVAGVISSSVPNSMSLLSEHERQIGTVLIDIGTDITEISIYIEGLQRYVKVLPIGGDNITNKISRQFRIPKTVAEKIKIENATLDGKFTKHNKLMLKVDSRKRIIYKGDLQAVLQDAYKKIFIEIKEAAYQSQIFRDASNGVVLAGGASVTEGAAERAEIEFGCPVRVGHITEVGRCSTPLSSHIFATAVGLVKYGLKEMDRRKGFLEKGAKNIFSSFVNRTRGLYREYF